MPVPFHSVAAAAATLRDGPPPSVLGLDEPLGALGVVIRREAGEEIFAEGEEAEAVYQIVSGAVRSYRILGDGRRHVCDFHMPGDVLGLEAGETHLCTAEGMTPVVLRATPRRVLQRLSVENGLLGQRLWALTVCGMRRCQDHASMLSRLGATERVAAFLVSFADRLGADDELELPMTRQDIADYLGLTIHTVSRTLSQLEDMGMIDARATRRIRLRRQDELAELCA
ncbi:helix-turn-helix domain-containing protein [Caulobacter sp.]|uniref:helix-turn-helix domain-containing protein n=1 Tax=Caulobacter sp. TaxID=78 RepID=UPI002B4A2B76|nr:helix-turn-helix domain-containing protein [Caulobacter sp.]HJV40484.1 helix-turn-helix domain-containing protein [Caulobacter sp.]